MVKLDEKCPVIPITKSTCTLAITCSNSNAGVLVVTNDFMRPTRNCVA